MIQSKITSLLAVFHPLNPLFNDNPVFANGMHCMGELNSELLAGLVDVDWVRMNQLAGNPCVATLVRRWKECQVQLDVDCPPR